MNWFLLLLFVFTVSCTSTKKVNTAVTASVSEVVPNYAPGPHAMVYLTTSDFREYVPVQLDDAGENIVSYPHPTDLVVDGHLRLPTILKNGYLLDNKGITKNVAFLNLSYATYAALDQAPSLVKLNKNLLERSPLVELCDCGLRSSFTDVEAQLNQLIASGKLRSTCKVLK